MIHPRHRRHAWRCRRRQGEPGCRLVLLEGLDRGNGTGRGLRIARMALSQGNRLRIDAADQERGEQCETR